jgi:hypothetical protein
MGFTLRRRHGAGALFYAAAVYLALALLGTLALMLLDAHYFENIHDKNADQGALLTALVRSAECPAVSKTREHSFSPSRQRLPSMIMPASFFAAGPGLLCAIIMLIAGAAAHDIQNTILLQLRI